VSGGGRFAAARSGLALALALVASVAGAGEVAAGGQERESRFTGRPDAIRGGRAAQHVVERAVRAGRPAQAAGRVGLWIAVDEEDAEEWGHGFLELPCPSNPINVFGRITYYEQWDDTSCESERLPGMKANYYTFSLTRPARVN